MKNNSKEKIIIFSLIITMIPCFFPRPVNGTVNDFIGSFSIAHGQINCEVYGPSESIIENSNTNELVYEIVFMFEQNPPVLTQVEWISVKFFDIDFVNMETSELLQSVRIIEDGNVTSNEWRASFTIHVFEDNLGRISLGTYYLLEIKYEGQEALSETSTSSHVITQVKSASNNSETSYDELKNDYDKLLVDYNFLESDYNSLKNDSNISEGEPTTLLYVFVTLTVIFGITTIYFAKNAKN